MKVTIDFWRTAHLATLIVLTYAGGRYLIGSAQWWQVSSQFSAYAISCFVVCQISNILLKLRDKRKEKLTAIVQQNSVNEGKDPRKKQTKKRK